MWNSIVWNTIANSTANKHRMSGASYANVAGVCVAATMLIALFAIKYSAHSINENSLAASKLGSTANNLPPPIDLTEEGDPVAIASPKGSEVDQTPSFVKSQLQLEATQAMSQHSVAVHAKNSTYKIIDASAVGARREFSNLFQQSNETSAVGTPALSTCTTLKEQYRGRRFLQVRVIDEQLTNALPSVRELLAFARLTNRTLVEPYSGSSKGCTSKIFTPPSCATAGFQGASGLSEVLDLPRIINDASMPISIITTAEWQMLAMCGALPAAQKLETSDSATGLELESRQDGQVCLQKWDDGHCERSSVGFGCKLTLCTHNQHGWLKQASGPALLLVACCFRKREGAGATHVTSDFPVVSEGTLTDGEVAAIKAKYLDGTKATRVIQQIRQNNAKAYLMPAHELRFGPAAAAAAQFLTKHALIERGFVGVHWRSEQVHTSWDRQNSVRQARAVSFVQIRCILPFSGSFVAPFPQVSLRFPLCAQLPAQHITTAAHQHFNLGVW